MNAPIRNGFVRLDSSIRQSIYDSAGPTVTGRPGPTKSEARPRRRLSRMLGTVVALALLSAGIAATARAQTNKPVPAEAAPEIAPGQQLGNSLENQAAQYLNLSDAELEALKKPNALLTDEELNKLCAAIAAKHLSPVDVQTMASGLALTPDQLAQVNSCPQRATTTGSAASRPSAPAVQSAATVAPQGPSSIETRFRDLETPYSLLAPPSPSQIAQFGYELFSSRVSTFAPAESAPVSDDYTLGPDDKLNLLLWGRINQTLSLDVQRDGTILMPEIGPIDVAGLTFGQAKQLIERRGGQITGLQVDVTMGQVRAIQVFVIGKVNQPGLYTVSALSHISNALVAAGGVSKIGSLRNIELRRDNRVIDTLDLYDLLLQGDTSADVRLRPRDVIFVPVIGSVVAITGDVKDPAIYELRRNESLGNVLRMAGGVTAFGYSERLQVERVEAHERRVALDINLKDRVGPQYPVQDGDLVKVFTVLPRQRNVVTVQGNVNRPGTYQLHPGMTVRDLVSEAQGVADQTFFDYALVRRFEGPERKVHLIPFNLDAALSTRASADNLRLESEDTITIYNLREIGEVPGVVVRGEVRKPGGYPLTPGLKVRDLIYEAQGLNDSAARDRAKLVRVEVINGATTHYLRMDIDLQSALADGPENVALKNGDELFVQQASNWHQPWQMTLGGEVVRPGPYPLHEGERLVSVLREAGGFRPGAYPRAAVFIRQSVKQMQQDEIDRARARLQEEVARLSLMPRQAGQGENSSDALKRHKEHARSDPGPASGRKSGPRPLVA